MTPEERKIELRRRQLAARQRAAVEQAQPQQERNFGDAVYDNIIGNPDDGVQSFGESLGTWLNRGGESMTLGLVGDEASAAVTGMLPGRSYGDELDRYRENEETMSGVGRLSADVVGALVPAAGLAGAVGRGGNLVSKVGRGMLGGAAAGGAYGYMEGEGGASNRFDNAATNAAFGGAIGGAIPIAGAAVKSVADGMTKSRILSRAAKSAPSSEQLRAQGRALYNKVDAAGVQIKPSSFMKAKDDIVDALRSNTGFDELPGPGSLTPNTSRVVDIMSQAGDRMASEPTAALPFKSLDQMRRQAGAAAGNVTNKADQKAGMAVIEGLDDFVQRLGPDDIVDGDPEALKSAIGKAREIWGRMSRSQLLDDAMERGDNYLSGTASGIRNQFKNILNNKKLVKQFTPAEREALRSVTHGNALNQIINLAGGGLAQMGSIGGGLAAGGPLGGLAGTALAVGQRKLSETVTTKAAETARAAIASGALRNPDVVQALALSGKKPEFITNTVLNALMATSRQPQK